jgi:uncharacterized protein
MDSISLQEARALMLAAQGLDRPLGRAAVKDDVLATIRQMRLLQIDTINVIARSPYVVLWSRLGNYNPRWLDQLQAERALFEYWSHAYCFLPIEDYPLHRRKMLDAMSEEVWPARGAVRWSRENPEVIGRVLAHLHENGEVRSADFDNSTKPPGGWWNWKDEKNALEALLMTGDLMVASRRNFQRVYVLREKILPDWDDRAVPSTEEVRRTMALRAVACLGVATASWVSGYFHLPKTGMPKLLQQIASEGALVPVEIEGLPGRAYLHPDNLALRQEVASGGRQPRLTTLLSPFDPLVSDRQRARDLFGFDYTIECYTPAAKRRYGYLNLPILHRGRLAGRLDPKAHRVQGLFEVKALHLEPGVEIDDELIAGLAGALRGMAAWHSTPDIAVRVTNPPEFGDLIRRAVEAGPPSQLSGALTPQEPTQ